MSRRGSVYLLSLAVVLAMLMASGSLLMRGVVETSVSERSYAQQTAFHLAEAGVDQAAINLRTPNDATDDVNTWTLPESSFTITPPACVATQSCAVTQPFQVIAQGTSTDDSGFPRRIEAVMQLSPVSVFQFALFGDQQMSISGNAITNSYDSRLGAYIAPGLPGANALHDGDIGTNRTTAGGIAISGSIFVDGQVAVGSNVANPQSVVTGYNPALITGGTVPPSDTQDVVSQANPFPMPDVMVPPGLTCSDYTVAGLSVVTLPPGTYCYHNLTIQGSGTLTASGPVTVYLTGELSAKGNSIVGVVNDPTKMVFLMSAAGGATIEQTITGSNLFFGAIYGPHATINISGNAEVFGSIIAGTVNVTGSATVIYDQALREVTDVANVYKPAIISWRDL